MARLSMFVAGTLFGVKEGSQGAVRRVTLDTTTGDGTTDVDGDGSIDPAGSYWFPNLPLDVPLTAVGVSMGQAAIDILRPEAPSKLPEIVPSWLDRAAQELVEVIELDDHPWFVAVQYHPEFRSKPTRAHPLFREFIAAACERNRSSA